ncbi:MAG: amidohydrolase family protein [Candidatus Bathyarchaeia archaeon]|nr:amidohydrolase family protein [Candidatus Bathyarchaeota archaeon]
MQGNNKIKAIIGGVCIDGTGAEPIKDSVIVIEDSMIREVGRLGDVQIPSGAEIIDAKHRVIMPGIIDCHTHISAISSPLKSTGFGFLEWSDIDRAVRSVATAKRLLSSGITTIRDVGSFGNIDVALRDAINDGVLPGPRILASGTGLTCTGGHVDGDKHVRYLAFHNIRVQKYRTVDGVSDVIRAVRELIKLGVDWIKFWASGGVLEATERAHAQEFSEEEIDALIKEAGRARVPVCVHALAPEPIKICIESGVRSIEHGIFADEECIKMMKDRGVYLVPTFIAYELLAKDEKLPRATYEIARRAIITHEKTVQMAKRIGVKIAMGTDSGSPYTNIPGECQAWELEQMVRKGFSAMESIVAATKNAAECLGVAQKTGTIEPGKSADLIIIDGDPLRDIKVLQDKNRIKLVMKEGKIYFMKP